LRLEDPVIKWLGSEKLSGLHRWEGRECSDQITCAHLLAHTSGLPDYLQDRPSRVSVSWPWERKIAWSWLKRLEAGEDWGWTAEDAMVRARQLQAHFAPGTPGRAHYSDLNYQLLGRVLEAVTGLTFEALLQRDVLQPLGLGQTYLFKDAFDNRPEPLRYRQAPLHIPLAMTSFGPDGGVVSTVSDLLYFTRAFFDGTLFPLPEQGFGPPWTPLFFPLESGLGVHRFRVPRLMDPLRRLPTFIGHSGLSGTVAFHVPDRGITIVGTVNQVAHPDRAFRLMIRLAMSR